MIKVINEAKHLTDKAKEALLLSNQDRINYVRRSRWIGYTKAKRIEDKLEDLLSYPPKHRMPNLLIVGDTNNGKTSIINRFCEKHPRDNNEDGEAIIMPVLFVEVPPVPDEASLYNAMLEEWLAPHKKRIILIKNALKSKAYQKQRVYSY